MKDLLLYIIFYIASVAKHTLKSIGKKELFYGLILAMIIVTVFGFIIPVGFIYYDDFMAWRPSSGMEFY